MATMNLTLDRELARNRLLIRQSRALLAATHDSDSRALIDSVLCDCRRRLAEAGEADSPCAAPDCEQPNTH